MPIDSEFVAKVYGYKTKAAGGAGARAGEHYKYLLNDIPKQKFQYMCLDRIKEQLIEAISELGELGLSDAKIIFPYKAGLGTIVILKNKDAKYKVQISGYGEKLPDPIYEEILTLLGSIFESKKGMVDEYENIEKPEKDEAIENLLKESSKARSASLKGESFVTEPSRKILYSIPGDGNCMFNAVLLAAYDKAIVTNPKAEVRIISNQLGLRKLVQKYYRDNFEAVKVALKGMLIDSIKLDSGKPEDDRFNGYSTLRGELNTICNNYNAVVRLEDKEDNLNAAVTEDLIRGYIDELDKDGGSVNTRIWGSGFELEILSKLLGVKILLAGQTNPLNFTDNPEAPMIELQYVGGNHYHALSTEHLNKEICLSIGVVGSGSTRSLPKAPLQTELNKLTPKQFTCIIAIIFTKREAEKRDENEAITEEEFDYALGHMREAGITGIIDELSDKLKDLKFSSTLASEKDFLSIGTLKYVDYRNLAMAIAPVNSSGDVYHLLAFTILSKHFGKLIPKIYLAFDKPEGELLPLESKLSTYDQVNRAIFFTQFLGYESDLAGLSIDCRGVRAPSRQENLREALKRRGITHYLDGKLATSIIAECIRVNGAKATTDILRAGFSKIKPEYEKCRGLIEEYVNTKMKAVVDKFSGARTAKPLVIIHLRYSSKANSGQEFEPKLLTDYLKDTYNILYIYADGRRVVQTRDTVDIAPFMDAVDQYARCKRLLPDLKTDLGKVYHLNILLALHKLSKEKLINLAGIIGNTSGTLDLAAFIGLKVLDCHNFGVALDYQGYRLMVQSLFLTIIATSQLDVSSEEKVNAWLRDGDSKPGSIVPFGFKVTFGGLDKIGVKQLCAVCTLATKDWTQLEFTIELNRVVISEMQRQAFLGAGFSLRRVDLAP